MPRRKKQETGRPCFLDPFPKYLQIRDILLRRIARDAKIGDRLPTEAALGIEFGVSRETVRDALEGLETDGIIERSPGIGTFITRLPRQDREARLTGLSEDFTRFKLDTEAEVLFKGKVTPGADVDEAMGAGGRDVFRVFRLRLLEGSPFALHEALLPLELGLRVAKRDLTKTSIVHVLGSGLGLNIWEDRQQIDAVSADVEESRLLKVNLGAPLLHVVRQFHIGDDQSIVLFRSHYRADRYLYTVKLAARDDAASPASALLIAKPTVERKRSKQDKPKRSSALRKRA